MFGRSCNRQLHVLERRQGKLAYKLPWGSVPVGPREPKKCDLAHIKILSNHLDYLTVFFISKPVCLFLALLLVSAPLVACALPGQAMTAEEQDCCLHMSDECGGTQMADSHTCCARTPQVEASALKASNKYSPAAPQAAPHASLCSAPVASAERLPRALNMHSDSPSPPGTISVLRI